MADLNENAHSPAELAQRISAFGIAVTPQRLEVARVLLARPQHLSAEQILGILHRRGTHVSKATIYNTLNLFVRQGLVREVNVDPTRTYYDSNTAPHHHVYNIETGELTDIGDEEVALQCVPHLPHGTELEGVQVVVRVKNRR